MHAGFDEKAFQKVFQSHKPGGIGYGTLKYIARQHGWQEGINPRATRHHDKCYTPLGREDILALAPLSWCVKGVFPKTGLAAIFGASGSGKTFLALDLAFAISAGKSWFGYRTAATTVVYVALEGEAGLRNRLAAWEQTKNVHASDRIKFVIEPFQLNNNADVQELAKVIPHGSVVFIDTLNRAAPSMDENASKDMGEILSATKVLQSLTGGLAVLIHHTGKDSSRGMRGHSSLHAALDAAIEVKTELGTRLWSVAKSKDGEDNLKASFNLKRVYLGTNQDGDEITSCVIERSLSLPPKPEPTGKDQKAALHAIQAALRQSPNTSKAGTSPGTPRITFDAASAAVKACLNIASSKQNYRAKRLINGLIDSGHLGSDKTNDQEQWLWLIN